jgi:YegS/Rv2252/BmrU family lipid kinase
MRSAVLIYNPAAGRGRSRGLVDSILEALRGSGFNTEAWPTTAPGSATEQAREAAVAGVEAVIAFGGDGTLRETAFGLLGTQTALGFIPGGTVNVMALTFGIPRRAVLAAEALGAAEVREFDVGLCNGEPFLMQASAGIDAAFIARLNPRLKRTLARGALVPAAFGALASYRYPRIELIADGERIECSFAAICNVPFYGGRHLIQPAARPDDGRLDLVVFQGSGRLSTLTFASDLLFGRHLRRPDVETRQVSEVEILGPAELPLQIDGDALQTEMPVKVRLAPDRLRVLRV